MLTEAKAALKRVEHIQAELNRLPQIRKDATEMRESIGRMKNPESRDAQERWLISQTKLIGCDDAEKQLCKERISAIEECAGLYRKLSDWWNAHVSGLRGTLFRMTRDKLKETLPDSEKELNLATERALGGNDIFFEMGRAFWDSTAGFRGNYKVPERSANEGDFIPEVENLRMLVNHCDRHRKALRMTDELLNSKPGPGIPDVDRDNRLAELQRENDTVIVRTKENMGAPHGSEWELYLPRPLSNSRKDRVIPQGTVLVMTRRKFKALSRHLEIVEGDAPAGARQPYVEREINPKLAATLAAKQIADAQS